MVETVRVGMGKNYRDLHHQYPILCSNSLRRLWIERSSVIVVQLPMKIENDTVVLAFRYSIHKENMDKPENQQVAEKIISNFFGRPCQVRCVYEPQNNHLIKAALRMGAKVTSVEEK